MENDFDFDGGMSIRCRWEGDSDGVKCQDSVAKTSLHEVICVRECEENKTEKALEVDGDANLKLN